MLGEIRVDGELATAMLKGHPFVQAAARFGKVDAITAEADGVVFLDGSFSPAGIGGADIQIWCRVFHEAPAVRVQIEEFRMAGKALKPDAAANMVEIGLAVAGALGKELPSGLNVFIKDGKVSSTYLLPWDFIKPLQLLTVAPEPGIKHGAKGGLFIVRGAGPDVAKLYAYMESLQKAGFSKENPMAGTLKNPQGSAKPNPAPSGERSTPVPAPEVKGDINVKAGL